jgi:hypothetical protein
MAKKRISQLPVPAAFNGTEIAHVERSGVSRQILFGSAAVANVTTSSTDSTTGRVYRTQDFVRLRGTWTPSMYADGGTFGYVGRSGTFQQTDNMVHLTFDIQWNSLTGTPTGPVGIVLPYPTGASRASCTGYVTFNSMTLPANTVSLMFQTQFAPGNQAAVRAIKSTSVTDLIDGAVFPTSGRWIGYIYLYL